MRDGPDLPRAGAAPTPTPAPSAPPPAVPPAVPELPPAVQRRRKIGFFVMVFGMFMAILDIQIVSSAIADIQAGLAASPDEASWVQTSYLIAEVIMIPLSGFLSRLLSTRVLFTLSASGFTLASLACAFAWNLESMIVFRAIQGFLGGAMIPTVFASSFVVFGRNRSSGVSVLIGLVATMAPTIGPTLGGWLAESFSWHWLFLVNVGPGVAVALGVWSLVDFDRPDWSLLPAFDWIGLASMALFLGTLEYVVEEGPRNDWLRDDTVRTLAVVTAVAAVVFFWRTLSYRQPIVELRAFLDRNFAIGTLYSFMLGMGLYGSVFLLPLFLGRVRGYDSLEIGTVMAVTGMFQFAAAPLAGFLSRRMDLRAMLVMGLSLFIACVWLNAGLTAESGYWDLFLPQALRGFALMLCFMPINQLALGTLPAAQLKNASALYNLSRNLGGAIGLALLNTVMIDRAAVHARHLWDAITPSRPQVQGWLDTVAGAFDGRIAGDPQLAAMRQLSGLVQREALVLTYSDCFRLMAAVFALALILMPLVRKPRAQGAGGGH